MFAAEKASVTLYADQEHSGIRLVIFLSLFIGYLIGFRVVYLAVQVFAPPALADYSIFLACVGGFPIALLLIWGLEKILKQVWHSGLSLTLDGQGLYVHDRRSGAKDPMPERPTMVWSENLGQINWHFRLRGYPRGGRERRVPATWHGVATELQQDEARLSVYTLVPPKKAAEWTENLKLNFRTLNMVELYDNTMRSRIGPPSRPHIPNRLLQSKDGRFWLAERRRWEYGIELTPDDFATLMRVVLEVKQGQTINNNS